jgi:hypothetical protein
MTVLHDMTAADLLAAYKSKKLSPVEAIDAVIARIEAWEPKLKALYAPDFEGARKQGRRRSAGNRASRGALNGVPTLRRTSPPRAIRRRSVRRRTCRPRRSRPMRRPLRGYAKQAA